MRTVSTGAPGAASNMDMTLTLGGVATEYSTAAMDGTRPCHTPASTLLAASVRVSWHSAMMGHHSQAQKSPSLLPAASVQRRGHRRWLCQSMLSRDSRFSSFMLPTRHSYHVRVSKL